MSVCSSTTASSPMIAVEECTTNGTTTMAMGNTNNLILSSDTTKTDTISKKVINIYLTKGLEARKTVPVLRKQILLDSQVIILKDTIISNCLKVNRDLDSNLKKKEKEVQDLIKKEQTEYFWKRVFQVSTLFFATLFLAK